MYKLMVVAGPNRGTSYALRNGETSIGRQEGNVIVLPSSRVSKQHCVLVVDNTQVEVTDQGSANGTYVNGVLTKKKNLEPGDKLSIGNFVLELRKPKVKRSDQAPGIGDMGSLIQFPTAQSSSSPLAGPTNLPVASVPGAPMGLPGTSPEGLPEGANTIPRDPKAKFLWYFENYVMPIFYGLNLKHDWKAICIGMFGFFIVGNLVISVYPLMESNQITVLKETGRRARLIARQIAETNTPYLAANAETKTEIGSFDSEGGVRFALLVDLDNRIIAPQAKRNSYLASGNEATFSRKAGKAFERGRERGYVQLVSDVSLVAIEPVKVLDPRQGRNIVVAMAVVAIDTTLSTPDMGTLGIVYSKVFIFTAILGALVLLILYRLTLKPFEILNDDLDRVLKGETQHINKEFKFEDTDQLWDVINSTIERLPADGFDEGVVSGSNSGMDIQDVVAGFRIIAEAATHGVMIFDQERKIAYINPSFEQTTGVRSDQAIGQEIAQVARDDAFSALIEDVFGQLEGGAPSVSEMFEFSGVNFKISGAILGTTSPRGFVILAEKETDAF